MARYRLCFAFVAVLLAVGPICVLSFDEREEPSPSRFLRSRRTRAGGSAAPSLVPSGSTTPEPTRGISSAPISSLTPTSIELLIDDAGGNRTVSATSRPPTTAVVSILGGNSNSSNVPRNQSATSSLLPPNPAPGNVSSVPSFQPSGWSGDSIAPRPSAMQLPTRPTSGLQQVPNSGTSSVSSRVPVLAPTEMTNNDDGSKQESSSLASTRNVTADTNLLLPVLSPPPTLHPPQISNDDLISSPPSSIPTTRPTAPPITSASDDNVSLVPNIPPSALSAIPSYSPTARVSSIPTSIPTATKADSTSSLSASVLPTVTQKDTVSLRPTESPNGTLLPNNTVNLTKSHFPSSAPSTASGLEGPSSRPSQAPYHILGADWSFVDLNKGDGQVLSHTPEPSPSKNGVADQETPLLTTSHNIFSQAPSASPSSRSSNMNMGPPASFSVVSQDPTTIPTLSVDSSSPSLVPSRFPTGSTEPALGDTLKSAVPSSPPSQIGRGISGSPSFVPAVPTAAHRVPTIPAPKPFLDLLGAVQPAGPSQITRTVHPTLSVDSSSPSSSISPLPTKRPNNYVSPGTTGKSAVPSSQPSQIGSIISASISDSPSFVPTVPPAIPGPKPILHLLGAVKPVRPTRTANPTLSVDSSSPSSSQSPFPTNQSSTHATIGVANESAAPSIPPSQVGSSVSASPSIVPTLPPVVQRVPSIPAAKPFLALLAASNPASPSQPSLTPAPIRTPTEPTKPIFEKVFASLNKNPTTNMSPIPSPSQAPGPPSKPFFENLFPSSTNSDQTQSADQILPPTPAVPAAPHEIVFDSLDNTPTSNVLRTMQPTRPPSKPFFEKLFASINDSPTQSDTPLSSPSPALQAPNKPFWDSILATTQAASAMSSPAPSTAPSPTPSMAPIPVRTRAPTIQSQPTASSVTSVFTIFLDKFFSQTPTPASSVAQPQPGATSTPSSASVFTLILDKILSHTSTPATSADAPQLGPPTASKPPGTLQSIFSRFFDR